MTSESLPSSLTQAPRSPSIYLVESGPAQAERVLASLQSNGYRAKIFPSNEALNAACRSGKWPDVAVMDMDAPGEIPPTGLVTLVFASIHDDLTSRLAAARKGANRYLLKPFEERTLINALHELTDQQPQSPYRVLLVDDDPVALTTKSGVLRSAGMTVYTLSDPMKTLDALDHFAPDVLVLDVNMPGATGPEIASVLRGKDIQLPILFLSSETEPAQQIQALNRGGDDVLVKPVSPDHLIGAITVRAKRSRQHIATLGRLKHSLYEREREHQALDQHAIVSIADSKGIITYVNDKFCEISGYARDALLGQNHRLLKSGEHSPEFYNDLWNTIAHGKLWHGEICNRRKDGTLYWVTSTITPFLGEDGKPYQYVSIRTDITHVKAADQQLQLLKRAIESSNSGVSISDAAQPDMPLIYVNKAFERMTGYSRDEVIGKNCRFLQGEDRDQPELDKLRIALAQGCEGHALVRNYRKDGQMFWNELRIAPVHDAHGNITHFIGIAEDVSARLKSFEALKMSEDRLRRSQNYANIGTWDWNVQTGELYWSDRIGPLFGYTEMKLETTYDNFLAAIHPDDRPSVIAAVNACLEHDTPYEIEHRVVWPDGTVRWLLEKGAVVRDESGKPLQMLGVVQDINERKAIERALLERGRQLQEAQKLAHIGNWSADLVTGKLVWSNEIYRIFGYKPGSIQPSVKIFQNAVHPDDREKVRESEMHAAKTGLHDVVHRIVRPDGSVRHVHELAKAKTDAQGKLLSLSGTVQDVTAQMEDEAALIAARDEADRANQAKSEFLSSMSHELRTPMNAILGFAQLLEYDENLSEENKDSVHEILKAGEHLLTLINEVLDLARIESGHIDLSLEPVEVCPVLEECLSLVAPLADKRGINLDHSGLSGIFVRADRMRLKQVLLNLLSNAIKYNKKNGSVRTEVNAVDRDHLRICVIDNGIGISEANLTDLFQPFNRLDAESSIEGTGIGLTITKRIVEMMGGTIDVESELGSGSTFWIELPTETMTGSEKSNHPGHHPIPHPGSDRLHTVLYIEDNPANLKLVAQLLGQRKHIHLLTAHTPALGLELAETRKPDLILLDINMPGMNGYELLKKLKTHTNLSDIPVIALTANAMPKDAERSMKAGFSDYLTKPIHVPSFFAAIDRYL